MTRIGSSRNLVSGSRQLIPGQIPAPIVAALRDIRERAGITQAHLCQLMKTSPGVISSWENGHKRPSDEALVRWADALGYRLEFEFRLVEKEVPSALVHPQRQPGAR